MRRLLRTLFEIQSPSAQILGTEPPTPAWVRIFWAAFDVVARIARAVLVFTITLVIGLVVAKLLGL